MAFAFAFGFPFNRPVGGGSSPPAQTLLSVLASNSDPDTHTTIVPTIVNQLKGSTITVNNGGANELVWTLPYDMDVLEGWRPVANTLLGSQKNLATWDQHTQGTGSITDNLDGSFTIDSTDASNTASMSLLADFPDTGFYVVSFHVDNIDPNSTVDNHFIMIKWWVGTATATSTSSYAARNKAGMATSGRFYAVIDVTVAGTVLIAIGSANGGKLFSGTFSNPLLERLEPFITRDGSNDYLKPIPSEYYPDQYAWSDRENGTTVVDTHTKELSFAQGALIPQGQRDPSPIANYSIDYLQAINTGGEFVFEAIAPEEDSEFYLKNAVKTDFIYQDNNGTPENILETQPKPLVEADNLQRLWFEDGTTKAPMFRKGDVIRSSISFDGTDIQEKVENVTQGVFTAGVKTAKALVANATGMVMQGDTGWTYQNVTLNDAPVWYTEAPVPIYNVGDTSPLSTIADINWLRLDDDTVVQLHKQTNNFKERIGIHGKFHLLGISDNGNKPVIDGVNAVTDDQFVDMLVGSDLARAVVHVTGYDGKSPDVILENVRIQGAQVGGAITLADQTAGAYDSFPASLWATSFQKLVLKDVDIVDGANGLFTAHLGGGASETISAQELRVDGVLFQGSGVTGDSSMHQVYASAKNTVYSRCTFDYMVAGTNGAQLKDRSARTVARYCKIFPAARIIDFPAPHNTPDYYNDPDYGHGVVEHNLLIIDRDDVDHSGNNFPFNFGGDNNNYRHLWKQGNYLCRNNTIHITHNNATPFYHTTLFEGHKNSTFVFRDNTVYVDAQRQLKMHSVAWGSGKGRWFVDIDSSNVIYRTAATPLSAIQSLLDAGWTDGGVAAAYDPHAVENDPTLVDDATADIDDTGGSYNTARDMTEYHTATTLNSGTAPTTPENVDSLRELAAEFDGSASDYEWTFNTFQRIRVLIDVTAASASTSTELYVDNVLVKTITEIGEHRDFIAAPGTVVKVVTDQTCSVNIWPLNTTGEARAIATVDAANIIDVDAATNQVDPATVQVNDPVGITVQAEGVNITYDLDSYNNAWFKIDANTGVVTANTGTMTEGTETLRIRATDGRFSMVIRDFDITIGSTFSTTTALAVGASVPYNNTFAKTTGQQILTGDYELEFVIDQAGAATQLWYASFRRADNSSHVAWRVTNSVTYILVNGVQQSGLYQTVAANDKLKLKRVLSGANETFEFYQNDVLIWTSNSFTAESDLELNIYEYTYVNVSLSGISLVVDGSPVSLIFDSIANMTETVS